mgnify:CR=1 FL=1
MIEKIYEQFKSLTGKSYEDYFKEFVNRILSPEGAQILGWIFLIMLTYLLVSRRVRSASIIVTLYILCFILAYVPAILKILRG